MNYTSSIDVKDIGMLVTGGCTESKHNFGDSELLRLCIGKLAHSSKSSTTLDTIRMTEIKEVDLGLQRMIL